MPEKLNIKIVKERFYENGFILLEKEYKNNNQNLHLKDFENYEYSYKLQYFYPEIEPAKFYYKNPYTEKNISLWLKLNNKPFILVKNQKFISSQDVLYFHCLNCPDGENPFKSCWNEIQQGKGCGICEGRQVGKWNSFKYLHPDISKEWSSKNTIRPEDVSEFSHADVIWECCKCKHVWSAKVSKRSNGGGCPKCRESRGEKSIFRFLSNNEIYFVRQHRIKNCRNIFPLPFDFYLPDHNLCIEYDGEFHFELNRMLSEKEGIIELKKQQTNDKIKTKYCKDNNVYLLRIPYWEFSNIDQILTETLFS